MGHPLTDEQWGLMREYRRWAAEFLEFMERLKARQGSVVPDFGELYRRKAELERRYDRRP